MVQDIQACVILLPSKALLCNKTLVFSDKHICYLNLSHSGDEMLRGFRCFLSCRRHVISIPDLCSGNTENGFLIDNACPSLSHSIPKDQLLIVCVREGDRMASKRDKQ